MMLARDKPVKVDHLTFININLQRYFSSYCTQKFNTFCTRRCSSIGWLTRDQPRSAWWFQWEGMRTWFLKRRVKNTLKMCERLYLIFCLAWGPGLPWPYEDWIVFLWMKGYVLRFWKMLKCEIFLYLHVITVYS